MARLPKNRSLGAYLERVFCSVPLRDSFLHIPTGVAGFAIKGATRSERRGDGTMPCDWATMTRSIARSFRDQHDLSESSGEASWCSMKIDGSLGPLRVLVGMHFSCRLSRHADIVA